MLNSGVRKRKRFVSCGLVGLTTFHNDKVLVPLGLALRTALGLRRSEEKVLVISMKMVFKMSIDGQYLHSWK